MLCTENKMERDREMWSIGKRKKGVLREEKCALGSESVSILRQSLNHITPSTLGQREYKLL